MTCLVCSFWQKCSRLISVELLNEKTDEIERIMNEKKTLVADVLQIPLHDYDTITEVSHIFVV